MSSPGDRYDAANFTALTPLAFLPRAAAVYPEKIAVIDGAARFTYRDLYARCRRLADALRRRGIGHGETVAVMAPNVPALLEAHFGVPMAGAVLNALNYRLDARSIAFILAHGEAKLLIADCEFAPVVKAALAEFGRPVPLVEIGNASGSPSLGGTAYETFLAEGDPAAAWALPGDEWEPIALNYTSGTTGNPKGVLLTHRNVLYEVEAAVSTGAVAPGVRWVSYLPLAHIAERMFSIYLAVATAGHVHFCPQPTELIRVVGAVKPTSFFGVPRVWEKVRAGIQALLTAEQDEGRRQAVAQAMDVGRRYIESRQFGHSTPAALAEEFARADQAVLGPIRSLLGLGEASVVSSAAAPLPPDVGSFFAGLGLAILDIYGMTETTGAVTSNTPDGFKLGTVGRVFPGMEARTAEDGEICVRGPLTTPGYLNLPEQTAALIDADGWLHTGDIGSIDEDGFLSVVDRKKELIITSGGENLSPAAIESLLVAHPLIGQALAFGDLRPYVVALLTLDGEVAPAWAKTRGIEAGSLAELAAHPAVLAAVGEAVSAANERLARVQQVKRWRLLPVEWTADTEELTPTLKLKRRIVHAKYADDIDVLYAD